MRLSINTSCTYALFGLEKTIKCLADAGFDAYDVSLAVVTRNEDDPLNSKDRVKEALRLKAMGDSLGIVCNQAHATVPSYPDEKKTAIAIENVKKEIETAALLGAENIVVHPKQHLEYLYGDNKNILRRMNDEFYAEMLEIAEKCNINIATENMWRRSRFDKHIIESVCASPEEFCEYVDVQNNPRMVACFDIGHATLVGRRPEDMIYALGKGRLKALHVHDNDGKEDSHVFPKTYWLSTVDWSAVLKALADIDYEGDFTYETASVFKNADEYTAPAIYRYAHELGRSMIREFEEYKLNK